MTNFMSTVDKSGRIFLIFCLTYTYLYIKERVKIIIVPVYVTKLVFISINSKLSKS